MRLHTLVVSPSASGKGYGKKFVKFYEDYALSHGCPEIRMDTNARNAVARGLYQKSLEDTQCGIVPTLTDTEIPELKSLIQKGWKGLLGSMLKSY